MKDGSGSILVTLPGLHRDVVLRLTTVNGARTIRDHADRIAVLTSAFPEAVGKDLEVLHNLGLVRRTNCGCVGPLDGREDAKIRRALGSR